MTADEKIRQEFDALLAEGEQVKASRKSAPPLALTDDKIDQELYFRWATRCLALIDRVFGTDGVHFRTFHSMYAGVNGYHPFLNCFGTFAGAKLDFEGGFLLRSRTLITAEVFADFMEQAEHLLAAGYHCPAAVLVGAVLEDGLRRLCAKHAVAVPDVGKLDKMNADLAKGGAYDKLQQKNVTAWADVRNKAAHGEWTGFKAADVEDMLRGVRRFLAEHPA